MSKADIMCRKCYKLDRPSEWCEKYEEPVTLVLKSRNYLKVKPCLDKVDPGQYLSQKKALQKTEK